ncbi:DUF4468 domain-containing protein [Epilithonimonas lactis]|uniref:DUF4468 domain-containing protein n=1 Tax=Epilithonimonas lactis TaxID=421072 RepID=A0A085BEQ6_9FLAO|nr:DUF4468 domain-containing protein [Epilithonimonas lactis]KFC20951.1 hypothetical protein IO89_12020 [Epilithonimonas lactis]SEP67627.1 protein of unknown function [Epilithonimonas lactis]
MKKILLFAILISGLFSSQTANEFSLTKENGLTDYVVTETPNKTKEEIYKKTLDWINRTYQRADDVIQGQIENEYVRFQGVDKSSLCKNPNNNLIFTCIEIRYQIEISVKDGKYKFDVLETEQHNYMYPKFSSNPWMPLEYKFDKKGNVKPQKVSELPREYNRLNENLKDYILNGAETNVKNDW